MGESKRVQELKDIDRVKIVGRIGVGVKGSIRKATVAHHPDLGLGLVGGKRAEGVL